MQYFCLDESTSVIEEYHNDFNSKTGVPHEHVGKIHVDLTAAKIDGVLLNTYSDEDLSEMLAGTLTGSGAEKTYTPYTP